MTEQFADLINPQWWPIIQQGMRTVHPARLPEWPLRLPLSDIALSGNFLGRGLGYDVFRIPKTPIALKIAMNRDPRAMTESFIDTQCETYTFWRTHMGERFMPDTVLFAYPHPERPGNRGCQLQTMVAGKALWEISEPMRVCLRLCELGTRAGPL